ncbi:MAG: serine/threonine-protein kinase, partial [Deltaproteobacteria bacterium]|nr:serine/threonine-protein kinase [Deltaproteobacteria bacterium]
MAPPTAEALLGRTLVGRYRLDAPLGRGGHGVVYAARDLLLERDVAVKVFAPRAERDDARFLREARIAARIDHPGVVRVFDLGRDDATSRAFMAQELLRGPTLRDWLEEHLVATPAQAMALLGPVMEGLAAAHARGVIHRDVKPENVVLAEGPGVAVTPKLIDFGVASLVEPDEASSGAGRAVAGTPAYMAPELARGEGEPDPRTDVWAVGVMLYELLLGRRPYDADGTRALVAALAHAEPVRFARRVPSASPALCAVVERALAPAPADRFPGVDVMRDALARCDEVSAPDAPWSPSAVAASTRTSREALPVAPIARAPRPAARWLVAVAVCAALAAVGVAGARMVG